MVYKKEYVSVIIPIYNGEKFINKCMECLLQQIYDKVQIIIVNDGSTDNTELFLKSYEKRIRLKGYEFVYLYQENRGAASAVNLALKYVLGEYIMLYDVDDILTQDAISEKAKFLNNNADYDLVRNNGYYVDDKGTLLNEFLTYENEKTEEHIFVPLLKGNTFNWAGSYMIRTEKLFNEIKDRNIYESKYGQNLQILLPVAKNGKSGFINKYLLKYIQYSESHSHTLNNSVERRYELLNGYEDIRLTIINGLNINDDEKKRYIKLVYLEYLHKKVEFGYINNRKDILFENFNKLWKVRACTKLEYKYYLLKKFTFIDKLRKLFS